MTLITGITLPEDGQTASTTDYNAAVTKIIDVVNGKIDDNNISPNSLTNDSLNSSADPASLFANIVTDYVVSGGVWSISSGLTGTMSEAKIMIGATEYTVASVGAKIFSSSQDTYVDVGVNLTVDYTSVGVGATPPALEANHVRLARITTDGSNITQIAAIREGGVTRDRLATDAKTVRSLTQTTTASLTPDTLSYDQFNVTALATGLTINPATGVLTDGLSIIFRIKDNGTARALTWNSIYRIVGVDKPTTTVVNKTLYVGCVWNSADTKWDMIAVGQEA